MARRSYLVIFPYTTLTKLYVRPESEPGRSAGRSTGGRCGFKACCAVCGQTTAGLQQGSSVGHAGSRANGERSETTIMINRNLTRRLEDLESRNQPVRGEPTILNVRFVDTDMR